jgi:AraC-like DNA-binding protein
MFYYSNRFKGDAVFESAGMFVTDIPWRHSYRVITSYEIILLLEGELPIEINGNRYIVKQNEFFVVPPHMTHGGYRDAPAGTRFLWFHFNFGQQKLKTLNSSNLLPDDQVLDQVPHLLGIPTHSAKMDMQRIMLMSMQLLDIYQEKFPQDCLNAYLNTILYEITYQSLRLSKENRSAGNDMQPIQDWIRIHAFEDISLQQVADYFSYNKNYLSRKYKAAIGIGIANQITKFRIDRAKFLLSDTNKTIQEIANEVGYEDAKYFMRIFKQLENNTPSNYRKAFQKKHYNKE